MVSFFPSPNCQSQLVGELVLWSVKFTVNGTVPEVTSIVKLAVGCGSCGVALTSLE